jgi:hypothetical protein
VPGIIKAEHVWEHLMPEQGATAARICHRFLRPGGYVRVAVPDGLHPDPKYVEWVRPGGSGLGAWDHTVLHRAALTAEPARLHVHRARREKALSPGHGTTPRAPRPRALSRPGTWYQDQVPGTRGRVRAGPVFNRRGRPRHQSGELYRIATVFLRDTNVFSSPGTKMS